MNDIQADEVYDILVDIAGAPEGQREAFTFLIVSEGRRLEEWRFQGHLGFGGKFWQNTMTVNCYREDETPERLNVIYATNYHLTQLAESWKDRGYTN